MLSIRDCLDYCNLTDEDVTLLAEHEAIPKIAAAQLMCGLVQTPEGVLIVTRYMQELAENAHRRGDFEKAQHTRRICARFISAHDTTH